MRHTVFLALAALLLAPLAGFAVAAEQYNVILLMTDEHNPRVTGCYGDPLVKTPAIDSLAAKGVRFTSAYCQDPICVPSRVSLVSGRMPFHLNTFDNSVFPTYKNITTLADTFGKAGYQTAWFGKSHWGKPRFQETGGGGKNKQAASIGRLPKDSQVSKWPAEKNGEHFSTEEALAFLEENKGKKFFLGVSFLKPHFPFTIQEKYYDMYKGKVSPPYAPENLVAELPAVSKHEREKYKLGQATAQDIERASAMYYGMLTYVDGEFGRILKKLDDLGLRDNTIIIYTADHGEMLGERGIWYKNSFYEGAARIPFIWSFPKSLPQDKVISAPAMNMDIFPTLCDLCNLPKPEGLEGTSLLPLMQGTDDGKDRRALSENFRDGYAGRMIRTQQWKYFFYTNGEEYLYDMLADPREEKNLIKDPAFRKTADDLRQRAQLGWADPTGKKKGKKAAEPEVEAAEE